MSEWLLRALELFAFRYEFATFSLLASVVVGLTCGVVGVILVARGLGLLGDVVGHATLPGVCVAFMATTTKSAATILGGGLVSGLAAAWAVGRLSRAPRTRPDAALVIVLSVFFAAGVLLLSIVQRDPSGQQSGLGTILFGNAAAVDRSQLGWISGVAAVTIAALVAGRRPLWVASFDPGFASSVGLNVRVVDAALMVCLGATVVVSMHAVGVVLVSAMMVIPPSAALMLTRRPGPAMAISGGIGVASAVVGAAASYATSGLSTGPAMVLVAAAVFVLVLLGRRVARVLGPTPVAAR